MQNILDRKTRLVMLTPTRIQGREIVAEVKPWGLELRQKGRRLRYGITWDSIYTRAAQIFADKQRAERKARRDAARKEKGK